MTKYSTKKSWTGSHIQVQSKLHISELKPWKYNYHSRSIFSVSVCMHLFGVGKVTATTTASHGCLKHSTNWPSWSNISDNAGTITLETDLALAGDLVLGQVDTRDGSKRSEQLLQVRLACVLRQVSDTDCSSLIWNNCTLPFYSKLWSTERDGRVVWLQ